MNHPFGQRLPVPRSCPGHQTDRCGISVLVFTSPSLHLRGAPKLKRSDAGSSDKPPEAVTCRVKDCVCRGKDRVCTSLVFGTIKGFRSHIKGSYCLELGCGRHTPPLLRVGLGPIDISSRSRLVRCSASPSVMSYPLI